MWDVITYITGTALMIAVLFVVVMNTISYLQERRIRRQRRLHGSRRWW